MMSTNSSTMNPYVFDINATTTLRPADRKYEIVVNWGQNLGGNEMALNAYCDSKAFDIIIINTVDIFFDDQNTDNLPGFNLANHCNDIFEGNYKSYLQCYSIGKDIKGCQKNGKKIVLSLGGGTRWNGFASASQAKLFANNLWNLFMGGTHSTRSFGDAVIDGINIDLRFGDSSWFDDFFTEMRTLMASDKSKVYLITSSPSCAFPDFRLGKIYVSSGSKINSLYVNFGDNSCSFIKEEDFSRVLDSWMSLLPTIFIGIPSSQTASYAANHYIEPSKLPDLFSKYIQLQKNVGGILLSDVTYDDKNVINGTKYSDIVGQLLHPDTYILSIKKSTIADGSFNNRSGKSITHSSQAAFVIICFLVRFILSSVS